MSPDIASSRILVVDDQPANVRLLERVLATAGYADVHATTDPGEVETLVRDLTPDLVLLDLHMPRLDGFALLERLEPIRRDSGYLPVLVLTADVEPTSRRRALELGATDFVTKPFDAAEVILRCRNLVRTRQLYRAVADRERALADALVVQSGALRTAQQAHRLVIDALSRLPSGADLETRAGALVDALGRSAGFSALAVLALEPDGAGVPIAMAGEPLLGPLGQRIPAEQLRSRFEALHTDPRRGPADGAADGCRSTADPGMPATSCAPIVAAGRVVGALCAGSSRAATSDEADRAALLRVSEYGTVAHALIGADLERRYAESATRREIEDIVEARAFRPVFQPVLDVRAGHIVGFEALTRFDDGVRPDARFAAAHRVGLGLRLEEETLIAALAVADELPHSAWLSVNASPEMLVAEGRIRRALAGSRRIVVIEITEHVAIADYPALRDALPKLGANVRLAIDDAGAGFASFRHVLELRPDFVKLDADLVRGIDADPARQALVVGMRYFAQKTGCTLIAEGIETEAERATLDALEIRFGQGYLLGRPAAASELMGMELVQ